MAEINIMATSHTSGGPDMSTIHRAWLHEVALWPGGGEVQVLKLQIGDCIIQVFPADKEAIKALADELKCLVGRL